MHGYLTYTGLIVSALGMVGVTVTDGDIHSIINGAMALAQVVGLGIAAYGRWRRG